MYDLPRLKKIVFALKRASCSLQSHFAGVTILSALLTAIPLIASAQSPPETAAGSSSKKTNPPAFTSTTERCIIPAATYHGINPWLLRAVLNVESALKPDAIGKNSNGTIDIGMGQINSIHLPELKRFGIEAGHLTDACVATYVSAWHLKKLILRHGNTWEGVARYHSGTPSFNKRYQILLWNELVRSGALNGNI